ncbi:MAG: di-heme oxidoredictase family protein, partial [Polyangiales bacterium]
PVPFATDEQLETFERGEEVARLRFTRETGLGPKFNVTECASCHEQPVTGGSAPRYRNFLLIGDELSDGTFAPVGVNGVQDQYTFEPIERNPSDPDTEIVALRNAIPFFGVGLLAEIPEEEILQYADPDDEDGDGISGRPNYDRGFVGRFGRKAQTVSIEGFIRGPLFNHLGITTNPLSNEMKAKLPVPSEADQEELARTGEALTERSGGHGVGSVQLAQAAAPAEPTRDDCDMEDPPEVCDDVPDPEMTEQQLFDLVSWAMLLAPPEPEPLTERTRQGRDRFMEIGCADCHVPALKGPRGLVPAYTDMLLHDMGPELADGIVQLEATGSEFRTQPLWGVAATAPYLHDGRADTLDEAIRMHGGEAQAARDAYMELTDVARHEIVDFLKSLGGADQTSEGLIPPEEPPPPEGEYGGPMPGMSDSEMAMFEKGRRVFDRDFGIGEGLGPRFNGDSCRACHFDPEVGGPGPVDVDVARHGILDEETGEFTFPDQGTMAHKHSIEARRPPIDSDANAFEVRQTPPIFGLGLLDRVPREDIIARADPEDADGDGISGRAHILPDGRLGRTGWKANVPNLDEFARDGLSNEMGVSLPHQEGLTFGFTEDDDDASDPEISREDVEALQFYMKNLAPPPRSRENPEMEDAGEAIFMEIGCGDCHVPELETADGTPVPAYTDLLLHDVCAPDDVGIAAGDATWREFRTPPLWGLAETAPYMHDGRASTVEQAIEQHFSEAAASRDAYMMLSADDRAKLVAFLESL